jgi:hypothetical protein
MRSLLLKSELVVFISSLVFKTPLKSIKGQTRTMVSLSLMSDGALQHFTAGLVRKCSRQQSPHDEDPENCAAPTKTVSIGRDQYSLILSGRDANNERQLSALCPAFHNAFCKRNNLSPWAKVGDVPCTRQAMRHKIVRSEVARDDTVIAIKCVNPFLSFNYKTATMLEVQKQNKLACAHLNELDFKCAGFLIKAQRLAVNLVQRLS